MRSTCGPASRHVRPESAQARARAREPSRACHGPSMGLPPALQLLSRACRVLCESTDRLTSTRARAFDSLTRRESACDTRDHERGASTCPPSRAQPRAGEHRGARAGCERAWTGHGQAMDRPWTDHGQAMDRPWTDHGGRVEGRLADGPVVQFRASGARPAPSQPSPTTSCSTLASLPAQHGWRARPPGPDALRPGAFPVRSRARLSAPARAPHASRAPAYLRAYVRDVRMVATRSTAWA